MKMVKLISLILAGVVLFPMVAGAEVKVYLDETRTGYVMADELDCSVYEGKSGITIGFKAGSMFFSIGPEITIGKQNSIKWDKMVHGIIARYKELCARFNSGAITMKEYNERIKEIDLIAKEMMELQEKMVQRVKDHSKDTFKELEEEAIIHEKVGKNIEDISIKIENLPEIK